MRDTITDLNIMRDWLERIVKDVDVINAAIAGNDMAAVRMMLRYFQQVRTCSAYEHKSYKRGVAIEVCDIIEEYLKEHNETEVLLWTETEL